MKLPNVTGSNLLRQKVALPADLEGEFNLLLIAFQRWQQTEVDSWLPLVEGLVREIPGFHVYELPTLQSRNILSRTMINEGMRAGIPDPETREHTVTLYLNKPDFRRALSMPDEDHIYLLLTDRTGTILWRARGSYTRDRADSLRLAILELTAPGVPA